MNNNIPIILRLQQDATDESNSVASLLRMAKVIATKLNQKDALIWINQELEGYKFLTFDDLPKYRLLMGDPKAYNRSLGWETIQFTNAENHEKCSKVPLSQALGSLEETIKDRKNGTYTYPYPPEIKAEMYKYLNYPPDDIQIFIGYGQLYGIVEAVRNLILNWTLELEKVGVLGENMSFSIREKKEASAVTQQFIADNINVGVLGNVNDHAQVTNLQSNTSGFDVAKLQDFIYQTKQALNLLPEETSIKLKPLLESIDTEIGEEFPDNSKIIGALKTIRTLCLGIAGNLASQGIVSIVTSLLG